MSFNVGLSGLNAANQALDSTGNNIANVATTGFKSSRTEFGDVYANSMLSSAGNTAGSGVTTEGITQSFANGNVDSTGRPLDMAISGNGFFVMSDNGAKVYTRAGDFQSDKNGFIVNTQGQNLQGYGVDANGVIQTGVLENLQINESSLAPQPTTSVSQTANLDSAATVPTVTPFDPSNTSSYTYPNTVPIYDSEGNEHNMEQYFAKDSSNTWTMYTLVDGRNPSDPTSTTPDSTTLTFNSDGSLDKTALTNTGGLTLNADSTFTLSNWVPAAQVGTSGVYASNGASANAAGINIDLTKATQYDATSAAVNDPDGYSSGQLSTLAIGKDGVMTASYTNGSTKTIGQIALANFVDPQGLTPVGGTAWAASYASGVASVGTPTSGTFGSIAGESLEDSNVNLTSELVDLIKEQSNYQANAKTISTQSTIMQTLIQMT